TRESPRTQERRPTSTEGSGTGTTRTPVQSKPAPPPTTSDPPSSTGSGSSGGSTGGTTDTPSEPGSTTGGAKNPIGGLLG
ncbi:hypothetical protein R6L23_34420, partial [Streptomyces sp. SR27]|nr:hypothetical protein [Streptomyces sp. SR27]